MSEFNNRYAKVELPKNTEGLTHPFNNEKNHQSLLEYLQQRLLVGKALRDSKKDRMVEIDKQMAGWMKLDLEDKKRKLEKDRTGKAQATQINLPLAWIHIDDTMTYFAQTFAPTRGMFYHTGKPDESEDANDMVAVMNNHAIYAGYYRQVLQAILSLSKYNEGGFHVAWSRDTGNKLVRGADNTDKLESTLRWEGNKLEAIDNYNLLRDPTVHASQLHCDGEFVAMAKSRSMFWLQRQCQRGLYFNCDKAIKAFNGSSQCVYYVSPPVEAQMQENESITSGTNWGAIMGSQTSGDAGGFELVDVYIHINPTEFGLVKGNAAEIKARSQLEIWKFTLLNNTHIIEARYQGNIHGYLPVVLGVMNDDLMAETQRSNAELIMPLQDFASFLFNIHVKGARKNLYGGVAYDPMVLDLGEVPEGETSWRVAMKPGAGDRDIRKAIYEHSGGVETDQTLQQMEGVMGLISQFFPTQGLPSQIASIDRAVDSQVAAVQQGANKRQQKAARLVDEILFRPMRFMLYYNIIQYLPDKSVVTDYYTGKPRTVNLQTLRETDLPFIIGQGLKAIDMQSSAGKLQQIIFALIQAPAAAQQIDILGLIDYWTSMIDIDFNMKQFHLAPPHAQGQDPAASGIAPATNPLGITDPIYAAGVSRT